MSPSQLIGVEPMNMIGCFPTDKSQMFVCDFILFNSVEGVLLWLGGGDIYQVTESFHC